MSTTGTSADDPLQAALLEAESLMESLGGGDGDDGGGVISHGSFAIDSDDDDDADMVNSNYNSEDEEDDGVDLHPLHDAFLKRATVSTSSAETTTTASSGGGTTLPGVLPPPQTSSSSPSSSHFLLSSASANVGVAPSMDVLKASTSRFASNLAHMAQRAANQVSTAAAGATAATTSPHFMVGGLPPTTAAAVPPAHNNYMNQQQQQQQPLQQQQMPELDADQKAALIQTHVGDLIPGERVIMFLSNVQHVSDSTGFQQYSYTSGGETAGGAQWWCCAMTFYRLVLFSTHPVTGPPKPPSWNTACWPTANNNSQSVLQIPLANMDKVEKSVFTAVVNGSSGGGFGTLAVGTGLSNTTSTAAGGGVNNNNNNTNTLTTTTLLGLVLHDKLNGRQLRFTTASYTDTNRAYEALQTYAFPGRRNLGYLFAFESKRDAVMASIETDPGTGSKTVTLPPVSKRFDAVAEFQRQFAVLPQQPPWSLWTTTNASYQVCLSYPSVIAGPVSLDEALYPDAGRVIRQCAAFRSEQRLPALTWCGGVVGGGGGASIWRCSQPKIGLQGNRSTADELFIKHILDSAMAANAMSASAAQLPPRSVLVQLTGTPDLSNWMPNNTGLKILDLRPRSAAMANRTGGYGYENTSNYPGCSLQFCNIGNIHAVRDSYQKLSQLCLSTVTADLQFVSAVEDTKWLSHIRLIWSAAWETAYWVNIHQMPVLLHCSHGWDRTSQVAVLAQLLLDPYYRTMAGFSCLVEKDFMSFGHPFHTRCGHGEGRDGAGNAAAGSSGVGSTLDEGQISPIFMQFLDCVFQLVRLYPECFEFNTKYLLCLSEHVYSCRFGNFLCDTERERELVAGIRQRTHSIWDYLDNRTDTVNLQYSAETAAGVLLMPLPTLMRNISLWTDRHCMHGPKPTTRWLPLGVERAVHPLINDQPSDLVTEQETQQLILSMPRTHVRTPLNATTEQPQEQAPPVESANNTLNGDSETPSS